MNALKTTVALASGLLFGSGLAVSGMTDPNKVLNFLDLTGKWDPSLTLVMASAIPIAALAFWLAERLRKPVFEPKFVLPQATRIDRKLIAGSALFGFGWGLGGYCPGPAVASLSDPSLPLAAFLLAMIAGMLASRPLAGALGSAGALKAA